MGDSTEHLNLAPALVLWMLISALSVWEADLFFDKPRSKIPQKRFPPSMPLGIQSITNVLLKKEDPKKVTLSVPLTQHTHSSNQEIAQLPYLNGVLPTAPILGELFSSVQIFLSADNSSWRYDRYILAAHLHSDATASQLSAHGASQSDPGGAGHVTQANSVRAQHLFCCWVMLYWQQIPFE